jgi:hypothetical protein
VISAKRALLTLALIALPAAALPASSSAAPPGPAWDIQTTLSPTNLTPGDESGEAVYTVVVTNVGSKPSFGPVTITAELAEGLSLNLVKGPDTNRLFRLFNGLETPFPPESCDPSTVSCTGLDPVNPGEQMYMYVPVSVAPDAPPIVISQVSVTGSNAADSASVRTTVSPEPAPFEIVRFESALLDGGGDAETHAGAHPYQVRVSAEFSTDSGSEINPPAENPKSIVADLPAGLIINPEATPVRCTEVQLNFINATGVGGCPVASAVGVAHITINIFGFAAPTLTSPVYNMVTPQGRPAELAFDAGGLGIYVHLLGRVRSDGDYGLSSDTLDIPQVGNVSGVSIDLWGDPSDSSHDHRRGFCVYQSNFGKSCPTSVTHMAFLTMPSACSGPLETKITANSWQDPSNFISAATQTRDASGNRVGVNHCEDLSFDPATETKLSTDQAETGTALDFNVDFANDGLFDPSAIAESTAKKVVVTLPEGMTINPSVGEGLGFCTPSQYKAEKVDSVEGEGCPSDSKVGTVHVDTPLLHEGIDGSAYLAQQNDPTSPGTENPFDTDIALYIVLRNSALGILVKQAVKVEPDPKTGQLVATLDDIPQIPFNYFNFHFKEGARAALISPSACGKYTAVAKFYPWSDPANPKTVTSDFEITKGVDGGPCPSGGVAPFKPDFLAGSINNSAGAFSPFNMRLIRHDGEQDMTKFSSTLPPGELGSLAGVDKCPDSAIALAKTKTGRQEKQSPSCPASSLIGHTYSGAGVGDSLTYVPGQIYLGGPYHGDPLSVVSVTPALAGPFDAGTVVVRLALSLNPKTAEVEVDGANSDPIPHILKGIVLKVRDLRVYVDRPNFTLNPTSCDPSSAKATLFGAYLDVFNPTDDKPVDLATRFQAADCASLGYRPALDLKLRGGTRRGGHPGLLATYKPRKGDANTKGIVVRLPRSAFLDQSHIRTICTRVQFDSDTCPPVAQYGYIKAWTPLLDEPLQGPVWLRSSSHKLPDLVFDLHGLVDVEVATRIDSARGGIRASVEDAPDAPISKVLLRMQGGRKGLIVNSRNLCGQTNRANVKTTGHNGKEASSNPAMRPDCGGKHKHKRHW